MVSVLGLLHTIKDEFENGLLASDADKILPSQI